MSNIVDKRLVLRLFSQGLTGPVVAERAGCSVNYAYEIKNRQERPLAKPIDSDAKTLPDICPCCGWDKTMVYDSRKTVVGLVRRRQCKSCKAKWRTLEIIDRIIQQGTAQSSTHI